MAVVRKLAAPPDTRYELTVVDRGPLQATVRAAGELDLAARDDLTEVLRQPEDWAGRVVVDLAEVTFFDCSCLGVLVASHHRLLDGHGLLVLTGVGEAVARVVSLTGLADTLVVVPTGRDPFGTGVVARPSPAGQVPKQRRPVVSTQL